MEELDTIRHFTSVDVELANNDLHSVCEIGIAKFRSNNLVETWRAVVDPECEFEKIFHSDLHGIRKQHTSNAPSFPEVYGVLKRFLIDETCIYHAASFFDPNCIRSACARYGLPDITPRATWLSTLDLSHQYWPDEPSHKLVNLSDRINHDYLPHNALEDAIACAAVFRALSGNSTIPAIQATGNSTDRPRTFRRVASQKRGTGLKGKQDGPFAGTFIVYSGIFTPPLEDRSELEQYLCQLGFTPRNSFSRKTQYLLIGEGAGPKKIKTAEESGILIINEAEFFELVRQRAGDSFLPS
jgi:DNA polymerase-3 subunit epsilon